MPPDILDQLIPLADAHQAADEYAAGHYDWRGNACAIGCTIRDAIQIGVLPENTDSADHAALAEHTPVPEWAWYLLDRIFEGLPGDRRIAWPPAFLRAAQSCEDWPLVLAGFLWRIMDRIGGEHAERSRDLWARVLDGESAASLRDEFASVGWTPWATSVAGAASTASDAWSAWSAWSASAVSDARAARDAWSAEYTRQRDDLLACMAGEYRPAESL